MIAAAGALLKLQIVAMNLPVGESMSTRVIGPIKPGFVFSRAVISWNIEQPQSCSFLVEARAGSGAWKPIGRFPSNEPSVGTLNFSSTELSVRLSYSGGPRSTIRMVTVAFESDGRSNDVNKPVAAGGELKGKLLEVQGGTPSSRLLAAYLDHWAFTLGRRDLRDTPDHLAALLPHDPGLVDLAALAGASVGTRGYVSFFHSIKDIETWTGIAPVICSVGRRSGNWVLVYGVDTSGRILGVSTTRNGLRRQTLACKTFQAAWERSGREVLIVQPKGLDTPEQDPASPSWIHLHFEPTHPVEHPPERGY